MEYKDCIIVYILGPILFWLFHRIFCTVGLNQYSWLRNMSRLWKRCCVMNWFMTLDTQWQCAWHMVGNAVSYHSTNFQYLPIPNCLKHRIGLISLIAAKLFKPICISADLLSCMDSHYCHKQVLSQLSMKMRWMVNKSKTISHTTAVTHISGTGSMTEIAQNDFHKTRASVNSHPFPLLAHLSCRVHYYTCMAILLPA